METARDVARAFDAILSRMNAEEPQATDDDLRSLALAYFLRRQDAIDREFTNLDADQEEIIANWREDLGGFGSKDPIVAASFKSRAHHLLGTSGFLADHDACTVLGSYLKRAETALLTRRVFDWEEHEADVASPEADAMFIGAASGFAKPETTLPAETNPRRLLPMSEVHKRYKVKKERIARSSKTVNGYDYVWGLVEDCFDVSKPMAAVTRDETTRFEEVLRRLPPNWKKKHSLSRLTAPQAAEEAVRLGLKPIAANTLYGYLSDLAAFFRWAEKEDYIAKNVALGLAEKPTGPRSPSRLEFSSDDLPKLFGDDYRRLARKNGSTKPPPNPHELPDDPRYWVPLISLFTGMRLAEICQLTRKEVRDVSGIPCIVTMFDVSDEEDRSDRDDEDIVRSQKTHAALRAIPMVDELLRLGFKEFAERLPEGSSARLFPSLKPDGYGYIAAPVSRWFATYKGKAGIADKRKVFHSLRHTFRSAMRRAEVSHDVAVRVGGWSAKGLSDHYGTDNLVKLAHQQLNRIRYEGLDLSHLHRKPKSGMPEGQNPER